jgi:hypothetical protein
VAFSILLLGRDGRLPAGHPLFRESRREIPVQFLKERATNSEVEAARQGDVFGEEPEAS